MTRNAIEATGLTKHYGAVRALDGVDLVVPEGTVFGLLGPNGAGKTTTVRILTTLLAPDSGSARVAGYDVRTEPDAVRQRMGLAGQYATVDEHLTGVENLRLVGRLYSLSRAEARARTDELLGRFELSDAGGRVVRTYSGGMRRRLDLAAALVNRPPVLFLDEPTTGLDPRSRVQLWGVLEQLVGEGTTLLLTTQYLEEADRLAQRIAVVDRGRILQEGSPAELKALLGATTLTLGFLDAAEATRAARVLDGAAGAVVTDEPGAAADVVRLRVLDGAAALADAAIALQAHGLRARSAELREPSLDDVFLRLTGEPQTLEKEPA